MPDYDNTNRGALFRNAKKEPGSNQPDHTGSQNFKCPHCAATSDHWLSPWVKESKGGKRYFSTQVKPKDAPEERPQGNSTAQSGVLGMDDSIPF